MTNTPIGAIFSKDWINRVLNAILIGSVLLVMLTLVVFALIFFFGNPPFEIVSLTKPPTTPVCPGEQYEAWVEIQTRGTVVIFVYITNKASDGNHLISSEQSTPLIIPVGGKIFFRQSFIWYVPDAPPGLYHRVFVFRGHDTDEAPLIFGDDISRPEGLQPYTIGSEEECSAREKT